MHITVYSTTTCTTCHVLTQWLDKQGLNYQKKVVDEDPALMLEFMSVNDGMVGVPFTLIEKDDGSIQKLTGYDIAKLKAIVT